jgi:hypothetical protein
LFLSLEFFCSFPLGASSGTKNVEVNENLSKFMAFESEEGDLQKLNNSVCAFEFKLFVHCSISFDIQKK